MAEEKTKKKTTRKPKVTKPETLAEKLQYIQSNLKAPKSQYNSFGKYNYRNCEDILEALKPLLAETKCVLVIADSIKLIGDRYYVLAEASLSDDGGATHFTVQAYAREPESKKGMDSAQITGATSSYARKYALNGLFAIDDAKDADNMDNREPLTDKAQNISPPDKELIKYVAAKNKKDITPEESKILNFIIETLAPKVDSPHIIDIKKLKKVILDKYEQLPTKVGSAAVVIKYIADELGIDNILDKNDFFEGI